MESEWFVNPENIISLHLFNVVVLAFRNEPTITFGVGAGA